MSERIMHICAINLHLKPQALHHLSTAAMRCLLIPCDAAEEPIPVTLKGCDVLALSAIRPSSLPMWPR